ncbi:hypothetical protein ACB098_09G093100 [Castanea mollissima]|uniref:High mobility group B protein 6 n=1 Tax=Castanea mollissima TaxID=60419 RepID=A0A8J4QE99_9ROSI|nr:hypothetical protein CMV_029557 [Castanea mollissima]
MPTPRFPVAGDHKLRPKSGRTPLQQLNSPANHVTDSSSHTKPAKQTQIEICIADADQSNKENILHRPTLDASLAEELSAMRKKMERLRSDRERTEKMLRERDLMLEMKMKEVEERGEIQKSLEIELDRLYRLKQLQSQSVRVSTIRSLREKEQVKKSSEWQSPSNSEMNVEDREESEFGDESIIQSPGSASSAIVTEK